MAVHSSAGPCELPRRRIELEVGPRRHRRVTAPAGLLLFVCLFLPAVRSCGETIYPLELPMFWHPYVYGLALALGACAVTVRGVRRITVMLRGLGWLTLAGAAVMAVVNPIIGIFQLVFATVLLAMVGTRGYSERRIAGTGIVVAAASLLWFGLWASSSGALVGVYLSLLASICLLTGALLWLSEL
jgi:hypothetical protein